MLLMIDNYDSFTFNLVQYFGELGQDVRVLRNDEIDVAGIESLQPARLVLSPGPCTPAEAGVCLLAERFSKFGHSCTAGMRRRNYGGALKQRSEEK